jgi:hypothetical protein
MGEMPHNRQGLIPMLVAIRVAAERKRRKAAAQAAADGEAPKAPEKKKRGWFG